MYVWLSAPKHIQTFHNIFSHWEIIGAHRWAADGIREELADNVLLIVSMRCSLFVYSYCYTIYTVLYTVYSWWRGVYYTTRWM